LARDLLFRRFVGMGISDAVLHHTVFVRFRATLRQHGLFEVLFNEINQQLTAQSISDGECPSNGAGRAR
jgi:IS5 family transposase